MHICVTRPQWVNINNGKEGLKGDNSYCMWVNQTNSTKIIQGDPDGIVFYIQRISEANVVNEWVWTFNFVTTVPVPARPFWWIWGNWLAADYNKTQPSTNLVYKSWNVMPYVLICSSSQNKIDLLLLIIKRMNFDSGMELITCKVKPPPPPPSSSEFNLYWTWLV